MTNTYIVNQFSTKVEKQHQADRRVFSTNTAGTKDTHTLLLRTHNGTAILKKSFAWLFFFHKKRKNLYSTQKIITIGLFIIIPNWKTVWFSPIKEWTQTNSLCYTPTLSRTITQQQKVAYYYNTQCRWISNSSVLSESSQTQKAPLLANSIPKTFLQRKP